MCSAAALASGLRIIGISDRFISQGTPEELKRELGMDARSVAKQVLARLDCQEEKAR